MPREDTQFDQKVITDAQTMRALSHPVRIALLEALSIEGQLTATEAGEVIGESSTTCSFHLRQLAKYGFVEEAGGGKGRARPWRLVHHGLRFSSDQEDPEAEVAAGTLARLYRERQLVRMSTWLETRRSYSREWRDAASNSDLVVWLTPQELAELSERLLTEFESLHLERSDNPSARPDGALPVEFLIYSFPMQPPKGEKS
jgi:predicted ArsR family transcriptional regulator